MTKVEVAGGGQKEIHVVPFCVKANFYALLYNGGEVFPKNSKDVTLRIVCHNKMLQ